jgi:transposase InsO family protein
VLGEDDERPITPPPGSNLRFSRSDNGPEFLAKAVQEWIAVVGAKTAYIERGSPWENVYIESFNARLRRSCSTAKSFTLSARPKSSSRAGGATTSAHHNTHLSMSLKRTGFADRYAIPRGALGSGVRVR